MLLIASEAFRGSHPLNDVARELSLSLRYFSDPAKLTSLLDGPWRRIVFLSGTDVSNEVADLLCSAGDETALGVIVAADQVQLCLTDKAAAIDALGNLPNVAWLGVEFDFDKLAAAARYCRRRMLRVSAEDVQRALVEEEFVVRYQPKVERDRGSEWVTREAEALVRWQHPLHDLMGPLEFLPEVEEFGKMPALTEFVLKKTARQLSDWEKAGLHLNGCINLAPSLLNDFSLGDRYAAIVKAAGFECDRFTFEIIEQDLARSDAPHLQSLASLRDHGFRLSLDDFRVAAASLATLERLPFDEIKIHASAISNAQQSSVSLHVLAAVVGLAHNLGMSVCAEGVEDQETFDFLQLIECDKMQGFLISEAVLPDIIQRSYSARGSSVEVA